MATEYSRLLRAFVGASLACCIACAPKRASAFKEQGHRSIEAAAYQQLFDTGNGAVLIALIQVGALRGRLPLVKSAGLLKSAPYSPVSIDEEQVGGVWLGAHLPDHSFSHQLDSYGQCYHFMARAEDVEESPAGSDIPEGLRTSAYTRCMALLDVLVRGVLFDPQGSRRRAEDAYTIIHIVEDSFSEAHTARTKDWSIAYLKPWRLRTWLPYALPTFKLSPPFVGAHFDDLRYHVTETHHGAFADERDFGYLEQSPRCIAQKSDLVHKDCLSARGLKAADAVAELLILLAKHSDCAGHHECRGFEDDWNQYKLSYFAHERPEVSAGYSEPDLTDAKKGLWDGNLIGPSDYLDHPPPPTLGLGLATDFAESAQSLWLTGDIFVTRDPMKQHEISLVDLLSYSLQIRLPLETANGERPAGAAGEFGIRVPIDIFSNDLAALYIGARVRVAALVSRVGRERTRFVSEIGFGGINADLVIFERVWVGVEAPRYMFVNDNLGPDGWSTFWTVKAGAAVNAL